MERQKTALELRLEQLQAEGHSNDEIAAIIREERRARLDAAQNPIKTFTTHDKPIELDKPGAAPSGSERNPEVAKVVNQGINGRLTPPGRRI